MKKIFFNNQNIFPKTVFVSNKRDYFEFLLKKEDIALERVLFYPIKEDLLKNSEYISTYDIVVLYPFQKEEFEIVNADFRQAHSDLNNLELFMYLKTDYLNDEELLKLSKDNMFFKGLYLFTKLWREFDWNPSWIKDIDDKDFFWAGFTFLDVKKLSEKYPVIKKYVGMVHTVQLKILFNLLYSELSGIHTIDYMFFSKINLKDPYNINESELIEFDIEKLIREGVIYSPKIGVYSLIY